MLQNCGDTESNLSAAIFLKEFLIIPRVCAKKKKKSDSFPHSSCILWVVGNYEIGCDTSRSAQIIRRLSELQSSF